MRNVYFSFHYERDIWRATQIRKSGMVFGPMSVGFADRSIWEEAKTKGKAALQRLIDEGLEGTSATVVLIGKETSKRPWVQYEIQKSWERGNALFGLRIHRAKDQHGQVDKPGKVPDLLRTKRVPIRHWHGDAEELGQWVEEAVQNQCGPEETPSNTLGWVLAGAAGVGLAAWLMKKLKPPQQG